MIDKFNFYDVYSYLIPGLLLGAVIWLPHALVQRLTVASDLPAALVGVVLAYVVGHVLQVLADKVIPSTQAVLIEKAIVDRYPSDLLLDQDNPKFPSGMKQDLIELIQKRFKLDVNVRGNRAAAFFLCRNSVIAGKTASYVEQFQGMYVLMRGIASAMAIGCAYDLGWLWSPFIAWREILVSLIVLVAIAIVAAGYQWRLPEPQSSSRLIFSTLVLLGTTGAGALAADGASRYTGILSAAACLSLLMSMWAFGSYRAFTWTWAHTVYQHFYISQTDTRKESA